MKDKPQKKSKISLFPRIYRFITEQWKIILCSFVSGLIIIAIILQNLILQKNLQTERDLLADREKTTAELAFWKSKLSEYPNYRDLYFKIANLEYKLGQIEESKLSIKKTLELDPNFEKGRDMEKQLGL